MFYPKTIYDENHELDETELKNVIEKATVSDAIIIYNLLSKKGIGNIVILFLIVVIDLKCYAF